MNYRGPEYKHIDDFYECSDCGVVVVNRDKHKQYHEAILDTFNRMRSFIEGTKY